MIRLYTPRNLPLFFATAVALLFAAKVAFSAEPGLPPLQTLTAQKHLAGTAEAGARYRVTELTTLESGERFARLDTPNGRLWMQLSPAQVPRVGEELKLEAATYLFDTPVVEAIEEGTASDTEEEFGELDLQSRHPMNHKALGTSSACAKFIDAKGNFGPWGVYLMGRLSPNEHSTLFSGGFDDVANICPKFGSMGTEERKNFWVWLIASMANFESSCNEKVTAKGVNGTAAGLLQLHKGKEHLYGCKKGINSLSAKDNLECGLTMLNNDVRRTSRIFPSKNNYWEVLRPHTKPGQRTMRVALAYAPCH